MQKFEVGQVIEEFIGHKECSVFDMSDLGATLLVFFNTPTQHKIEQFFQDKPFEIRLSIIDNIMIFTCKIGDLAWMDMPYTVHLSKDLTHLKGIPDKNGFSLIVSFVDAITGAIKHLRLIGLSTEFSRTIYQEIINDTKRKFESNAYHYHINKIYEKYNTIEIANMSIVKYRLN